MSSGRRRCGSATSGPHAPPSPDTMRSSAACWTSGAACALPIKAKATASSQCSTQLPTRSASSSHSNARSPTSAGPTVPRSMFAPQCTPARRWSSTATTRAAPSTAAPACGRAVDGSEGGRQQRDAGRDFQRVLTADEQPTDDVVATRVGAEGVAATGRGVRVEQRRVQLVGVVQVRTGEAGDDIAARMPPAIQAVGCRRSVRHARERARIRGRAPTTTVIARAPLGRATRT